MEAFFNFIKDFINHLFTWFATAVEWVLVKVATWFLDLCMWFMDILINIILAIADLCGFKTIIISAWGAFPNLTLATMQILDVPFLIGLVLCAYALRFAVRMVWK